jgi:hypothetical protein
VTVEARLAELAEQYGLGARAVSALRDVLTLQAGDPTASTTVREPSEAVDRQDAD